MSEGEKESKIKELLTRGVSAVYPSKEFLEEKLKSGERLTIYLGMDPTGPALHVGHAVPLFKLAEFQKLGHKVIFLIGDFTAMIGDPTDKMSTRVPLTREEVLQNAKSYKKQVSRIVKFFGENKAMLRYNSKWLSKLAMEDFLRILSNITHAQTIKRDMFQKRISEGKDLYLHELIYPMLQGYDSVAMDIDGEIGGNDQIFNMLVGRDLMKKLKNKEKFVVATKLLVDSSGGKMGKTEGNMVALSEGPEQMFGKIMSWSDGLIVPGLELCTAMPMNEVEAVKIKMERGMNPRDAKLILAEEIVATYHSRKAAKTAKKNFLSTFSKKELPTDLVEFKVKKGSPLADVLVESKLISSKSDFARLVEGGAIREIPSEKKITDNKSVVNESVTLKIGKHRFIKIIAE